MPGDLIAEFDISHASGNTEAIQNRPEPGFECILEAEPGTSLPRNDWPPRTFLRQKVSGKLNHFELRMHFYRFFLYTCWPVVNLHEGVSERVPP